LANSGVAPRVDATSSPRVIKHTPNALPSLMQALAIAM
jgi:hypothetical protein